MQTAIVKGPYGGEQQVFIRRSTKGYTMHAPGWRAMYFATADQATAKVQKHHGFVRMEG